MKTKKCIYWPVLIIALAGFLFAGCANTQSSLNPFGVSAGNQPANLSHMTPEGDQKSISQGVGATNAKVDVDGAWFMTPGTGTMLAKDGIVAYFPGDMEATDISYDGAVFTAETLTISYSAPLKVQADAFIVAASEIKGMTQIEATKQIAIWVEIGKITQTVADSLLKYFVPTLPTVALPIVPATAPAPAPDAPPPAASLGAEPVLLADLTSERGI